MVICETINPLTIRDLRVGRTVQYSYLLTEQKSHLIGRKEEKAPILKS